MHHRVVAIWLMLGVLWSGAGAVRAAEPPAALDATLRRQVSERLAGGVLRRAGDAEGGAPFQMRDPHDPRRIIGFEVELMDELGRWLSQELGRELSLEMVQYDWVSLLPGLLKGDFDIGVSGLEIPNRVPEGLRYSRPYYIYTLELVVRREEAAIGSLADCLLRPVGTLSGSAGERALKAAGIQQIIGFDTQTEPYLDLELGRLDAVLLDNTIVAYYATGNPRLRTAAENLSPGRYGIALRSDDEPLARALEQGLGALYASGRWQAVLRKWRLWNPAQADLVSGDRREAELAGLGFDSAGRPVTAVASGEATMPPLSQVGSDGWSLGSYLPLLVSAAATTVGLTLASMALAVVLGLLVCVARLYGPPPLRWLALADVEVFRGVPRLRVGWVLYFGLSSSGLQLPAVATAILGFGLNYAAYEAEVYRSAILSVPVGQWEAALALGMSPTAAFGRVILPQALRTALAPMTNDLVALFKDTSLVSVIAVRELTKEYLILARSSLQFFELGLVTATLYLLMSVPLGYLSRWLERRWGAR